MQVIYNPENRAYLRINPDNDCEVQWASHPNASWQKYHKFNCPVMALALDTDCNCVVIILENRNAYLANHGAINQIHYPSGHPISVAYNVH
jgi:hypothetical protein